MKKIYLSIIIFLGVANVYSQNQFWGSCSSGGLYNNGFIFKTDSTGDNLEIVHHFQSVVDGENIGALLYAANNKLYGLASSGGVKAAGVFNGGTFFEYDLATDQFTVLQHFGPSNTALPNIYLPKGEGASGLTEVAPGLIYGLMQQGKYVFSYNTTTGTFSKPFIIPTYNGGPTNSLLHNQLNKAFIKSTDGFLYTSTPTNSSCPIANPNMGSIIRVNPATNALSVIHKSNCVVDYGFSYTGNMIEVNGKLYETTGYGGIHNSGVLFEYNPAGNTYTKKYDFDGGAFTYGPTSLVFANNGKLYGTAYGGGLPEPNLPNGGGVLYEFDLTTNTFTKKYDFLLDNGWIGSIGVYPRGLINSTNGKLYGVTQFGVFEYNTTTNEIRTAGRFWTQGFNPSILQLCRKPSYHLTDDPVYKVALGSNFTHDLESNNTTSVIWAHDGTPVATQTSTILSFTNFNSDDYGVWKATLTNECGTTITQSIEITDSALSTNNQSLTNRIKLYPNPATDRISISVDIVVKSIAIYNLNGQIVAENENRNTIMTAELPKGTYLIAVQTEKGLWSEKFIKE